MFFIRSLTNSSFESTVESNSETNSDSSYDKMSDLDVEFPVEQNMTSNPNDCIIDIPEPSLGDLNFLVPATSSSEELDSTFLVSSTANPEEPQSTPINVLFSNEVHSNEVHEFKPTFELPSGFSQPVIVNEPEPEKLKDLPSHVLNQPTNLDELDSQINYFKPDKTTLGLPEDEIINPEYQKKVTFETPRGLRETAQPTLGEVETHDQELGLPKSESFEISKPIYKEPKIPPHPNLRFKGVGTLGWTTGASASPEFYRKEPSSLGTILEKLPVPSATHRIYGSSRIELVSSTSSPTHIVFYLGSRNLQNLVLTIQSDRLKDLSKNFAADPLQLAYSLIKKVEFQVEGEVITQLNGYGFQLFNQVYNRPNYNRLNKKLIKEGKFKVPLGFDMFYDSFFKGSAAYQSCSTLHIYLNAPGTCSLAADMLYFSTAARQKMVDKTWQEYTKVYNVIEEPLRLKYKEGMKLKKIRNCTKAILSLSLGKNVTGLFFYFDDQNKRVIKDKKLFKRVMFSVDGREVSSYEHDDLEVEGFHHLGLGSGGPDLEGLEGFYWFPFSRRNDWSSPNGEFKSYSLMNLSHDCSQLSFDLDTEVTSKIDHEVTCMVIEQKINVLTTTQGLMGLSFIN